MPTPTAQSAKARPASVGFNLLAIADWRCRSSGSGSPIVSTCVGRAARGPPAEGTITRGIGGIELKIPAAFFRNDEDRDEGFADEIELIAHLPLGADGHDAAIEVTLLPRSRARPSAILLDGVYLHQFEDEQLSGPPGLVGKPLDATRRIRGRDRLVRRALGRSVRRQMSRAGRRRTSRRMPSHRRPRQRRGGLRLRGGRADELAPVRCGGRALARRDGHPLSATRSRRDRRRGSPSGNCRTGRRPRRRHR